MRPLSLRATIVAALIAVSLGCTPPDDTNDGGAGGGVFATGGGFVASGGGVGTTGGGSAVTGGGSAVTGGGDGTTGGGSAVTGGGSAVTGGGDGTTGGGSAVTGGGDGTTGGGSAVTGGGVGTTGGGSAVTGGGVGTTGGGSAVTGGGVGTTGGGTGNCTELTLGAGELLTVGRYAVAFTPQLGDAGSTDAVVLEFFSTDTGSISLTAAPNDNYETCEQCVRAVQDEGAKHFFQSGGSMAIDPTSDLAGGHFVGSISDVTLVEVTYDSTTAHSTPVVGGACLHITAASFDLALPANWVCDADYFGDGTCDCGCGEQDNDCASTTDVVECYDNCGAGFEVDPADTTQCIPTGGTGGGSGATGGGTGTTGGGAGTTGGGSGSAANDTCATAEALVLVDNGNGTATATTSGDTTQGTNGNVPNMEVSCSGTADATGQDLVYSLHLATPQQVTVQVTPTSTYNPAVYIRSGAANCANDAAEIECEVFTSGPVIVQAGVLPAGDYFIWVDTYVDLPGAFTMQVTTVDPSLACGNGQVDAAFNETCDDGSPADGDGCSATCQIEPGWVCAGSPSTCAQSEQACNDGADNDGDGQVDGADPECALPSYFTACDPGDNLYVYSSGAIGVLVPGTPGLTYGVAVGGTSGVIHRAAVLTNFTHVYNGDLAFALTPPGASAITLANGVGGASDNFTDTLFDSTCPDISTGTAPYSGCFAPQGSFTGLINSAADGLWRFSVVDTYPSADDGTIDSWKLVLCTGAAAVCGNSVLEPGETCDDGNSGGGDGCSASCVAEQGYTCVGTGPGSCTALFTALPAADCADMTSATTQTLVAVGTTFTALDEGYTATAALPFAWSMFGQQVDYYSVSSNGFVGFFSSATGALTGTSYTNPTTVPATGTPNGYLAPFWDDLDGTVVRTLDLGSTFVIEWEGSPYSPDPDGTMRFQVKLHQSGGAEFHYCASTGTDTRLDASSATIAAESTDGLAGSAIGIEQGIITWGTSAWSWNL